MSGLTAFLVVGGAVMAAAVICAVLYFFNMIQFMKGLWRIEEHAYSHVLSEGDELVVDTRVISPHAFRTCLGLTGVYTITRKAEKYCHHFSAKSLLGRKAAQRCVLLMLSVHINLFEQAGIKREGQKWLEIVMADTGTVHLTFKLEEQEHEALRLLAEQNWTAASKITAGKAVRALASTEPPTPANGSGQSPVG